MKAIMFCSTDAMYAFISSGNSDVASRAADMTFDFVNDYTSYAFGNVYLPS